jgi:dTDP-4-amino-4,6-dideoxygalactose transaminase
MKNFLPKQYLKDSRFKVKHNYLKEQFHDYKKILKEIETVIKKSDFTLGSKVDLFENRISKLLKSKYVVAVGSGTDALLLSLKALGVKEGDEVITTPYTFYATIGAIVTSGAKPVFVDVKNDYNINEDLIKKAITKKTKVILPVHWAGRVCEMNKINKIAKQYKLHVVEDSCHAILGKYNGKLAGTFGTFGCFSMHPLKNLNIWGDGGFVICSSYRNYKKMRLLRNHGLVGRDKNLIFGYNSRLDTVQAVVALNAMKKIKKITSRRIENAKYLDKQFEDCDKIFLPKRERYIKEVYHLYHLKLESKKKRDQIIKKLISKKIDAKIHYPTSMHLQPASKIYGYKKGDFLVSENLSDTSLSLPVHEFITKKDLYKISKIILNEVKK